MSAVTRRLLTHLREMMAKPESTFRAVPGTQADPGTAAASPPSGTVPMREVAGLVARELVAEVCSIYAMRPGDILELVATEGLRQEAVGRTRLRVGEGIVGLAAAKGEPLNLPDAQNHPRFAFRPETGEEPYASLLAVPVRRAGRTLGVLAVQNRTPRLYDEDEVDVLETVAMLLAPALSAAGATDGAEEGLGAALPRIFAATALGAGIAIGPVVVLGAGPAPRRIIADDPEAELTRLADAAETMRSGLDRLLAERMPESEASREILETYRLIAADSGWVQRVSAAVRDGLTAEAAVQRVTGELRDRMRRIVDPYLRERLADLEDLGQRMLGVLDGSASMPSAPPGAILLTRRLGPAQLLDWHARGIAGVVIEEGSPAGHAAIIARALGIPALGGARGMLDAVEEGDEAVLDADDGQLILRPEADLRQTYERALEARQIRRAGYAALRDHPARTRDGTDITLMLNVGLKLELDQLEATGAEGIGLFRTEIAMLARGGVADTGEQAAIYASVLDAAGNRPVLFRTLDLGGDKLLPGAPLPEEENPAMGWRSLRVGLDRPALLRRQLRALLLAANGRPLSVMFPMVATLAEYRQAASLLRAEAGRVRPAPERLQVGAMLEVPSLLWQLPALAREADFLSIGTNDLMQFLFAADRSTPALAARYDMLSATMLDILQRVVEVCREGGAALSVCGEAAARPLDAMVLAALGITTLSMPASSLLPLKGLLAALDLGEFRRVLAAIRRGAEAEPSLRETIAGWAREHGLDV